MFDVDPIIALAAVGTAVPELTELGTSVVPLAGRHPLALAAQARTAQSALKGRFTLGIGTSHQTVVEGFFGESYDGPPPICVLRSAHAMKTNAWPPEKHSFSSFFRPDPMTAVAARRDVLAVPACGAQRC